MSSAAVICRLPAAAVPTGRTENKDKKSEPIGAIPVLGGPEGPPDGAERDNDDNGDNGHGLRNVNFPMALQHPGCRSSGSEQAPQQPAPAASCGRRGTWKAPAGHAN